MDCSEREMTRATIRQPRRAPSALLLPLIGALAGCTGAHESARHWDCLIADDAMGRKQQVVDNFLPRVVFSGETKPASLEQRRLETKVPAISVAVIRNGTLDWSAAWGELELGGSRAGCETLFQAGSLSKPVTVLAAFRLQEAGTIDFETSIETYLTSYHLPPGKQTTANPVTFGNLFAHTSGVTPGGYEGYAQGEPIPTDQQTVRAEAPSNARKVEVLAAPGEALAYSGGGYTVAEIALQDRLGKPFERILDEWLLTPVGMVQADFTQPLPASSHPYTARGHLAEGGPVPGGWHHHPEQAAAGLWATAQDLATFLVELGKGYRGESKVFSQATTRALLAKPFDGHAYGFRLIGEGDRVFLTHYGGTVGYRAGMTMNLETGNGAVFLTNSDNGSQLGLEFFASVARVYDWPVFREVQVKRTPQPSEVLRQLAGTYSFADQGWKVAVEFDETALVLVFPNGDRYTLAPIEGAPLEFIHPETAVRTRFERDGAEVKIHLYDQVGLRSPA